MRLVPDLSPVGWFLLAAALKTYKERHGGYPISTGTCAGVYLAEGDREWFDGSALIADCHWSRNVYIVSNQTLAEPAKK
ncbi:hypothetical protein [Gulosibacter chungangensis]|uniref:Uncharacterized protein n=1 Tax=Gulosibacter chungangensis TaxID=979746 RepID=A0A7J5B9Q5_9MICO|nr:hypothetical protein [Gulosibacter chungangensis]KAB1640682.1 hypothetical protein F8O05_14275 [Gulosibacter chungangensis]